MAKQSEKKSSMIRRHWRQRPAIEQQVAELERWFDGESGQRMLAREGELVDEALTQAFGYHLVQLSVDSRVKLYEGSRVQRKFRCHPVSDAADVICDGEQLPFANESVDVVILHHIQEAVKDPHQLLRDVHRVVVPHGQVLILGFNPWSPLGVYAAARRFAPGSPWNSHHLSCYRVHDWLGLLGFETLQIDFGMRIPQWMPWRNTDIVNTLWRKFPFGSFYLISAIKQVSAFTPTRPRWKPARASFPSLAPVKTRPISSTAVEDGNALRPLRAPRRLWREVA